MTDALTTFDFNGNGVAINKTGDIILVGAYGEDQYGTDAGVMQAFKYSSGSTATSTGSGYYSHDEWEPLGSKIEPTQTYEHLGRSTRMNDDGYTFASVSRGDNSENRYVVVYRYSEESSDWYVYGYARSENSGTDYGITPKYLEISGDGEMVAVGAYYYNQGMIRQYKVLNGKLEPVGPAMHGDSTDYDDLGHVGMSSDGKIIAMAGLCKWDTDMKGNRKLVYTIITKEARASLKEIHHREPVMLNDRSVSAWINVNDPCDDPLAILNDNSDRISSYEVSKFVNKSKVFFLMIDLEFL